jgi:hypothetical protein
VGTKSKTPIRIRRPVNVATAHMEIMRRPHC